MTESVFKAALVQLRTSRTLASNITIASDLIREAAASGAQYVQTPENTNIMELNRPRLLDILGNVSDSSTIDTFAALAAELGIWLHLGSVVVRLPGDKTANRAILINPQGTVSATYDKIHMFDVDLPGGESYRESKAYEPGARAVLSALPWGNLGITICYDLRFPRLYRTLAQAGADFLAIPAAFTRQTGAAHWQVLQRARAIETGCYVLSAAQGGSHECGRETFGHSIVVSPWGEVIGELGEDPGVLYADIHPSEVVAARERIPALKHDRPFNMVHDDGPIGQRGEAS